MLFGRVLSAKAKYYLWLLLALRLCLPVTPGSPISLMNYVPRSGVVLDSKPAAEENMAIDNSNMSPIIAGSTDPIHESENVIESVDIFTAEPQEANSNALNWNNILVLVWLVGMSTLGLVYIILYVVTERQLTSLPKCEDEETQRMFLQMKQQLRVSDRIALVSGNAGMLGGLFHPTLVLPVECRGKDAKPVLVHELMHYKHKDLCLYLLFRVLTAVYWFNPLVWLCFWWARQDSEKACDERVLESGLVSTYAYAETLYREGRLQSNIPFMPRTTFGGSRHSIKQRIRYISRFHKHGKLVLVVAVVLALVITACGVMSVDNSSSVSVREQSELYRLTGYNDIDDYVESLQPKLGHFGWTFDEHVDAGYFQEADGYWESGSNLEQAFVITEEVLGQPMVVTYVFSVTLFTEETTWRQVLTEIHVTVPENMEINELGDQLLDSWQGLNAANDFVQGSYRTPVSVGDYLDGEHWDRVGELAVQDGRAETLEQGWSILQNWSFASLNYWPSRNSWQLNGTGMALYLTRSDAIPDENEENSDYLGGNDNTYSEEVTSEKTPEPKPAYTENNTDTPRFQSSFGLDYDEVSEEPLSLPEDGYAEIWSEEQIYDYAGDTLISLLDSYFGEERERTTFGDQIVIFYPDGTLCTGVSFSYVVPNTGEDFPYEFRVTINRDRMDGGAETIVGQPNNELEGFPVWLGWYDKAETLMAAFECDGFYFYLSQNTSAEGHFLGAVQSILKSNDRLREDQYPVSTVTPSPSPEETIPEPTPVATPVPTPEATPEPTAEATPEPTQETAPETTAEIPPETSSEEPPPQIPDRGTPPWDVSNETDTEPSPIPDRGTPPWDASD